MINEHPVRPAVVGVDGSVSALHATRWAAREAARAYGGFADRLVGSVALATTEHGHCPVAVVRPDSRERTGR